MHRRSCKVAFYFFPGTQWIVGVLPSCLINLPSPFINYILSQIMFIQRLWICVQKFWIYVPKFWIYVQKFWIKIFSEQIIICRHTIKISCLILKIFTHEIAALKNPENFLQNHFSAKIICLTFAKQKGQVKTKVFRFETYFTWFLAFCDFIMKQKFSILENL